MKYAMLMSHNSFLYAGLKKILEEKDIYLFCESEFEAFINISQGNSNEKFMIFYDELFERITYAIFHDRPYRFISMKDIRKENLFRFIKQEDKLVESYTKFKSKAIEKIIVYYFISRKMSYKEISCILQIPESRVSYFINNYAKRMNYRHKNHLILELDS